MKTAVILLLVSVVTSCKRDIDPHLIIGTWKPKNELTSAGLNSYSSITFLNNDSIIAETFAYGKLINRTSGKYLIDTKSGMLTTAYGDSLAYKLKIEKLTGNNLELYYPDTKQHQSYSR
jgi:hypothetical protein